MLNYTQIQKIYFSYLTPKEQKDPEMLKLVDAGIAEDLEGEEKRMKEDAVSKGWKTIFAWSGNCEKLKELLNVKIK